MVDINRSALLPFSAEQVFGLVNNVADYSLYMDGCVGTEVFESSDAHMIARLDLEKGPMKYSFVTRNKLVPFEHIYMDLEEGPFTKFEGKWTFRPLSEHACKVTLDIKFTMSNVLAGRAASKLVASLGNTLVDSLSKRANQIYG